MHRLMRVFLTLVASRTAVPPFLVPKGIHLACDLWYFQVRHLHPMVCAHFRYDPENRYSISGPQQPWICH